MSTVHLSRPHTFAGPYVTAVGGTTNFLPEVAADLSAGGFSNYFPFPPYQVPAVPNFLQGLGARYAGRFKCAPFAS